MSYHHIQIIHINPIRRVKPALVAHIKLRLYHFDNVRIDVPISIVPVWTVSRLIKQTLKHRLHWFNTWCVWIFQRYVYVRWCAYWRRIWIIFLKKQRQKWTYIVTFNLQDKRQEKNNVQYKNVIIYLRMIYNPFHKKKSLDSE